MTKHQIIKFMIANCDKFTIEEFTNYCIMCSDYFLDQNLDLFNYIKFVKEL